jgi:sporulation integral membrane protein YlbJ
MFRWRFRTNHIQFTLLLGLMAAFLVVCIILFPDQAFAASLQGLDIWWKIIFPALLPFLILSEILIAYGVLHFLGVWLAPLMRFLFRLPGVCGPVMAIGYTVGYPSGAQLTNQLREKNTISRNEGELLLALSHAASPIFILNVIAVGFFQNAQLGIIMIIIQLISIMIMGIMMRLFLREDTKISIDRNNNQITLNPVGLFERSISAMYSAHSEDGRTFGKLLGDAVSSSIQTLMLIGGFIMIFSVILQIMKITQITQVLYVAFHSIIPEAMALPLFKGIFELHLGSFGISKVDAVPAIWQIAMIGSLLAWSGLAMHAQVKSITHHSDLRYSTFLIARLLQAVLAIWLSFWLWAPLTQLLSKVQPSFLQPVSIVKNFQVMVPMSIVEVWGTTLLLIFFHILIMITLSMLLLFAEKITSFLKT